MKIITRASAVGFAIGFICFPIIVFGGGYLYFYLASDVSGSGVLDPPELPAERIAALDWSLTGLDGVEVDLREYARGRTLFLNVWATWCGPCVAEMPSIDKLYSRFGDAMAFVCVSNEDAATLKKFQEQKNYSFPIFYSKTPAPPELNAAGIPATFIIAPDGTILLKHYGAADWSHESVIAFLKSMVAQG